MWGQLFILISALLCIYIIVKYYSSDKKDFKIALIFSATAFIASELTSALTVDYWQLIPEFLLILSLSILLVAYLILIRSLRPVLFRYPYGIVYAPLVLVVSYMIVLDIEIMKHVFLMSAQGVGIFVFMILSFGYCRKLAGRYYLYFTYFLLISAFITGWFLGDISLVPESLWYYLLSPGMVLAVYGFTDITETQQEQETIYQ